MRFPTSSCLLCKHRILLKPLNTPRTALNPSQPASSLSAIHHGLRQSEKSRPQGFSRSSLETATPRRPSKMGGRDPDWTPPNFKIMRGKKDVTDTGPGRQSRRSRFNDPEAAFGKRSMVYQMKHGELREKIAELESKERRRAPTDRLDSNDFMKDFKASTGQPTGGRKDGFFSAHVRHSQERGSRARPPFDKERDNERRRRPDAVFYKTAHESFTNGTSNFGKERTRRPDTSSYKTPRESFTNRTSNFDKERNKGRTRSPDVFYKTAHESFTKRASNFDKEGTRRPDISSYKTPREEFANRTMNFDKESTRRPDISYKTPREEFANASSSGNRPEPYGNRRNEPSGTRNNDRDDARGEYESPRDNGPVRVPRTTAASQFLYGRSVVETAMKSSRRKLYNLYIYAGDDRQNHWADTMLTRLAEQMGVKITRVPNDGLRMMDKMSAGRPHNGCVLEASPLPQLPLKALGSLSEDPGKPGFYVELSHQHPDEADINGRSNFVSYQLPKERNPFVLLLDGILDPGNLGAILRTAAFLGVNGIAITTGSSAPVTPVALKASAGGSEVMTLFSVSSTVDFLTRSKENGWLVYAAVPSTKRSRGNSHLTVDRIETYDPLSSQPTVLVIGSEGEGLTKPVRRQANHEVSIPQSASFTTVDSLNVSVATAILSFAFLKNQTLHMPKMKEDPVAGGSEEESKDQLW
ncbi:RNA methyltransferase [Xylaria castorea]|nr:RNA methyltransferase [Xylaria castorea]